MGYGPRGCAELYPPEATEQTRTQKAMNVRKQGNYLQKKLREIKRKEMYCNTQCGSVINNIYSIK